MGLAITVLGNRPSLVGPFHCGQSCPIVAAENEIMITNAARQCCSETIFVIDFRALKNALGRITNLSSFKIIVERPQHESLCGRIVALARTVVGKRTDSASHRQSKCRSDARENSRPFDSSWPSFLRCTSQDRRHRGRRDRGIGPAPRGLQGRGKVWGRRC